jgi:DNA repair protein RecN (Recombination protein N)
MSPNVPQNMPSILSELHVLDFVLIERASLALGPGLTVVSGATGDGKTLLLRALRFLLGERAAPERTVRQGASFAVVEGTFRIEDPALRAELRASGAPEEWDDPDLVVSRTLDVSGRGRIKIGGRLASARELKVIGERLVCVLSQHEYQSLSRRERQRELLDRFGGIEDKVRSFAEKRAALRASAAERDRVADRGSARRARDAERRELLEALRALAPRAGELDELERDRDLLAHLGDVREALDAAHDRLIEREDAALDLIRLSARRLSEHVGRSAALDAIVRGLETTASDLAQAGNALARERDRLEADPERLARIEQRIEAHHDLARRFRGERVLPRELHARLALLEAEDASSADPEHTLAELDRELAAGSSELSELGVTISAARRRAARRLMESIGETLAELAMPEARVQVELGPLTATGQDEARGEDAEDVAGTVSAEVGGKSAPTIAAKIASRFPAPSGLDEVELRFAGTPGQPLLPLQAVASGGELARVCLAIKRALADADDTPLLVFDEVDQNVGGRLGDAVGRTLVSIGATRQVIAVTHLPSVAAYARHHFTVNKDAGRTRVRELASGEREHELALMIRGEPVTETALAQARELLSRGVTPPAGRSAALPGEAKPTGRVRRPEPGPSRRRGRRRAARLGGSPLI